jgi:protein involved in polysaccharide export with SLBB domain
MTRVFGMSFFGAVARQNGTTSEIGTQLPFGKSSAKSRLGTSVGALLAIFGVALVSPPHVGVLADSADKTAAAAPSAGADLPEYRLNVRDRIRVQVLEWRPSRDEVYSWTALNQVYTVDPSGRVSMPLVGSISAVGFTTTELGTMISRQLAKRLHLATLPDTTIEITDFRPIYVTGAVERTGEFSYTAGMSVMQGVSLAGGLFRNSASAGLRLEREWLTTTGNYQSLLQERQRLIARKARLEAELAGSDGIAFPADLRTVSNPQAIEYTASVMSKEQNVFDLRKNANKTQIDALDQLQTFLQQEVETSTKLLAAQQKQVDLLNAELSGIKTLSDKGLATQPRLLGLQRNLAELEGQKLRIESDRTRAQQDVSRAKISKIEYQNKRDNELTVEQQTTEARLEQISQEMSVDEHLLAETKSQAVASPLRLTSNSGQEDVTDQPTIHYSIFRQVNEQSIEIEANQGTILQPGDTVKVEMTMPTVTNSGLGLDASFRAAPSNPRTIPVDSEQALKAPNRASIEPIETMGP